MQAKVKLGTGVVVLPVVKENDKTVWVQLDIGTLPLFIWLSL